MKGNGSTAPLDDSEQLSLPPPSPPLLYSQERTLVPIEVEAEWPP